MSWLILFFAGILEAGWLVGIQKSEAFTNIPYVIFAIFSMTLSLVLFSIALKGIPVSHAYLVWLAIGASSISIINHYFFDQPLSSYHACPDKNSCPDKNCLVTYKSNSKLIG